MFPWIHLLGFQIPSFLLVQSLNACLLLVFIFFRAKKFKISQKEAIDIALCALVSGVIGARLFHIIWEAPDFYSAQPMQIFNLMSGGFVYFGGLLLGFLVPWIILRFRKEDIGEWLDLCAPILSLGTALGRIGCMVAGCCYGKLCSLPWAIAIVDENGLKFPRHPAPLYALFWELAIFAGLMYIDRIPRKKRFDNLKQPGSLFFVWMVLHGFERFSLEFIRDDFRGVFIFGFSIAQIFSVILVSAGAVYLARPKAVSK